VYRDSLWFKAKQLVVLIVPVVPVGVTVADSGSARLGIFLILLLRSLQLFDQSCIVDTGEYKLEFRS
jgi:hypothetical protein